MALSGSKSLHFGGKLWGEERKPTSETVIVCTVWHLDSLCAVFQQTLIIKIAT